MSGAGGCGGGKEDEESAACIASGEDGAEGDVGDEDDGEVPVATLGEGASEEAEDLVVKDALGVCCEDGAAASATRPQYGSVACSEAEDIPFESCSGSRRTRTNTLWMKAMRAVKKQTNPKPRSAR